jgi:hypothetical protein
MLLKDPTPIRYALSEPSFRHTLLQPQKHNGGGLSLWFRPV